MKMNNKQKMKVVVIVLLATMLGAFTHCMPHNAIQVGSSSDEYSSGGTTTVPKDEGQILHQTQVTTGVKNHEQILLTMGSVTGIDPYSVTSIMNIYRQVEMSLPTDNDIKIYSSTQQLAVTKLAAEFCAVLVSNATLREAVWPGLQVGNGPATALNANNRINFVNNTIVSFWGGMITTEEAEIVHDEFDALMTDIIGTDTNAAATQRAVRAVCISALSSGYITFL